MAAAVPREGLEQRGDVPTPRPFADEEEERGIAQADRPAGVADHVGIGGQRAEARARGRGGPPGAGRAGTPWTRATSRAVDSEGTSTRSARRAARR